MKTLIGGTIAAVLGIIGLVVWWEPFFQLLAGGLPFALLSGGALAIYLGYDELKDTWKTKEESFTTTPVDREEVDRYKREVDGLKKEIEQLKGDKEKEANATE